MATSRAAAELWQRNSIFLLCSALVLLLGSFAIIGWYSGEQVFLRPDAMTAALHFNSALGFTLAAVGLLALILGHGRVTGFCGGLVALLGGLTLLQYLSGMSFGIDELFIHDYLGKQAEYPGRMSVNSAAGFLFTGLALLTLSVQRFVALLPLALASGYVFILLGLLGVGSYAFELPASDSYTLLNRMPLYGAGGFMVLGCAIVAACYLSPERPAQADDTTTGIGLSVAQSVFLLILTIFSLNVWQAMQAYERQTIAASIEQAASALQESMRLGMEMRVNAIERMARRLAQHPEGISEQELRSDALSYLEHFPALETIVQADADGQVVRYYSRSNKLDMQGRNIAADEFQDEALALARNSKSPRLSKPILLRSGGNGVVVYAPALNQGEISGYIASSMLMSELFNEAIRGQLRDFYIRVSHVDSEVYLNNPSNSAVTPLAQTYPLTLLNLQLQMQLQPSKSASLRLQTWLPQVLLMTGLAIVFLLGGLIRLGNRTSGAYEQAREAVAMLENAQRIAHLGHWERDLSSGQLYWSDEMYRIFGLSPDTSISHRKFMAMVHPDDQDSLRAAQRQAVQQGVAMDSKYRLVHADGSVRFVHETGEAHYDAYGQLTRLSGSVLDITEIMQAEQELAKLNVELEMRVRRRTTELEASNKELEAFSYSVSHDLRAPLRHITGFIQLLQDHVSTSLDEKSARYLRIIDEAAARMGQLIDDLLDFSRAGRLPMQLETVDMDALIHDLVHDAQVEHAQRDIRWQIEKLGRVQGDARLLRLVWQNLISNALKFSRNASPVQIHIGIKKGATAGENVYFVRDNGVGFDMKYADKLFMVFQRLHAETEFEGTGIGLANVQRVVHRHSGQVWADGVIDAGACFYFSLPVDGQASISTMTSSTDAGEE